jgi:hypothetical protein
MKYSCSILLFVFLTSVTAAPAASNAIQVVPGPGLPSLESLGITSADLFDKNFKPIIQSDNKLPAAKLFKRQSPASCQTDYQATRGNAIACRNYLIQTGTYTCSSGDSYATLCTAGDAEIVGWNYYDIAGGVQTSCSDAAVAASWIIDNCSTCSQDNCLVEGKLFYPFTSDVVKAFHVYCSMFPGEQKDNQRCFEESPGIGSLLSSSEDAKQTSKHGLWFAGCGLRNL